MNDLKQFGEPSFPSEEVKDLKRSAVEKPNLAIVATWVLGAILAVIVIVSALLPS